MSAVHRRSLAGALALAIVAATPLAAQQGSALVSSPADAAAPVATPAPVTAPAPQATPAAAAGPTVDAAAAAVRAPARAETMSTTASASRAGLGTARAQMIVGFAALIAGAIIGDAPGTVIMIGGAALGLWGLYHYLQ